MKKDTKELETLFTEIGLANPSGNNYKERLHKHRQLYDYIVHIEKAVSKMSKKRTLTIVDCASGKSYLSFVANHHLTNTLKRSVEFICIDYNQHVIDSSREAARNLGYDNMTFKCDDIMNVPFKKSPDLVYSLHACNSATDMTIAKGIIEGAHCIMSVSCCQHDVRKNMRKHPLGAITRHGVYKDRLADMLSDSMRTLILEAHGYKADLFEYVPSSETPKNIMIRSTRGPIYAHKSQLAMDAYYNLKELFHVEPHLMAILKNENRTDLDILEKKSDKLQHTVL